jgi:hypothetical protein
MPGLKLGLVFWEMSRLELTETSAKRIISLSEYGEALRLTPKVLGLQSAGSRLLTSSLRFVGFS